MQCFFLVHKKIQTNEWNILIIEINAITSSGLTRKSLAQSGNLAHIGDFVFRAQQVIALTLNYLLLLQKIRAQ